MPINYICYNNKFFLENQAVFGVNRAMKYGDGVFETIRIRKGKLLYLSPHLNRLRKGLLGLNIEFTPALIQEIQVCIDQLIIKNELEQDGLIRLTAFRGGGGKYRPKSNEAGYFIEGEKLATGSYELNRKGLAIELCENVKITPNQFSNYKTLNALPYVMASMECEKRKYDELLLLNNQNRIVEATSSNVFFVVGNQLYTPNLEDGCLAGVVREVILNKGAAQGFSIQETAITLDIMDKADEIFICNSSKGIQWVASFRKKRYFNKVSRKLMELL